MRVQLGDECRDTISGFSGVCVARTEWLNGCWRITLQPQALDNGKLLPNETFDEFQIEVTKRGAAPVGSKDTGGPRGNPMRASDPR
jgi:hypothetical protein